MLIKLGKPLAEEEIKKILAPPQKQVVSAHFGLGGWPSSDKDGEELFPQYQMDEFKKLSETELEKRVKASQLYDDGAYFALVDKYFRKHADDLRRNVDDKFNAYFEEGTVRIKSVFGDSAAVQNLLKQTRGLEEYLRKRLTRQGLDVLCAAQKPEDLQRIRANLQDGYAGASKLDAEYLGRYGEWTDIPMLANAKGPKLGATLLTMSDDEFQVAVARAIIFLGKKHSVSDLLSLEMPAAILKKTIELCTESQFAKISHDTLLALFNHKAAEVRKAAALLTVRALPVKRIKAILHEYVISDNYRYYNVIHWLDLGVSMRRDNARKVALAAGN